MLVQISTFVFVSSLVSVTRTIPLEAAFQGRCESSNNPCDQNCMNIHHNMFECFCKKGFILHDNGYSCFPSNSSQSFHKKSISRDEKDENRSSQLSIQIEVDIDPPPHKPDDPSDEEMERLGLPLNHIHFSTGNTKEQQGKKQTEELLRPEDIKIFSSPPDYQSDDPESYPDRLEEKVKSKFRGVKDQAKNSEKKLVGPASSTPDSQWRNEQEQLDAHVEPPRALPDTQNSKPDDDDQEEYRDHVYEIDAFCNLDCGAEGECFMSREKKENNVIKKRCLCPHGKYGERCSKDRFISAPQFSGQSYMALPTLTNAYSDLQLSMEFRPASLNGVLLLTGENADMTGDFLALTLKEGHVELRLDCGTGPGIVRTRDQVHLHRWNQITVFRHDWGVWIQLNEGIHEEGRSQGLFSRITFAQPVVLGGSGSFANAAHFLDSVSGFHGCIRRLEINNKIYNFEPAERGGDALYGIDIGECSADSCSSVPCQHGGFCLPSEMEEDEDGSESEPEEEGGTCQCPLGFGGEFCEQALEIKIPYFNDSSYLTFFGIGSSSLLWNEIELVFKSESEEGLLVYNGDNNDGSGDFLAIFLSRGFVEVAFDNGDGVNIVRSQYPIQLNQWQTLTLSRSGRLAFLTIKGQETQSHFGPGAFNELSLNQNLYLGGVPTYGLVSPYIPLRKGFRGCVQKLTINDETKRLIQSSIAGVNVSPCRHACSPQPGHTSPCGPRGDCQPLDEQFICQCPLGLAGVMCEKKVDLANVGGGKSTEKNIPSFGGDGFLFFKSEDFAKNLLGTTNSITIRLRAFAADGLILWTGGDHFSPASDYLLLAVKGGFVNFRFNLGNGEGTLIYNLTKIDDGKWHRIRATRTEQTASLRVDNGHIVTGASPGKLRQLNGNGQIFIGGTEELDHMPLPEFRQGLVGCIADFSIGQMFNLDLVNMAEKGRNVENCSDSF